MTIRSIGLATLSVLVCLGLAIGCGNPTTSKEEASGSQETASSTETTTQPDGSSVADTNTTPEKPTPQDNSKPPADRDAPTTDKDTTPPENSTPPEKPTSQAPTYYNAIKALFETRCLACHKSDGIGPMPLTEYDQIFALRPLIKQQVKDKIMPPWPADNTCKDYHNNFDLSEAERKTILDWIDQGAKKGDPKDYKAPPPPKVVGLDRVDLNLKMKKAFTPKKRPDDYRCFVLDWPAKTDKYIVGFQVKPGNPKLVHHIITYLAKPKEASRYTRKDPNGGGYRCTGTAGGPAALRWLGVWAPGLPGSVYPKDTGIKVEPGSKIIIQIHYNVLTANPSPDQTAIEYKLEDKVKREALLFPWTNPKWLGADLAILPGQKNMPIPAGQDNVTHSFAYDPFVFLSLTGSSKISSITIHSAMLHMHWLGKSGKLFLKQSGKDNCLVNIPRWDFNWQMDFQLKKPITIQAGAQVGISCTWNNTAANQPTVEGVKLKPKNVTWGEGTQDEMCLGIFYITCNTADGDPTECPDLGAMINR